MRGHDAVSDFESAVRRTGRGDDLDFGECPRRAGCERGEIIRYEGMVVDVTERRRAEEALRAE